TASTIGTEWVRQDGWAVAPPLDAADGATRVSALLTLISADAHLAALEARGDLSGLPVTDWLPLTSYFEDGEARVATVDLGLEVDGIELRVPERELEAIADLRFSGSDPALLEETAPATETGVTRSALRAELTGLGIVTREEWGARRGTCTTRDGVRRRISIHHTEGGAVDPARQLRGVQSYHQSKGWCDVGYHFLIGADGRVYEGRPVELLGAHVRDNNPGNLGIAFIGCFDRRECATPTTLTDAMIESAGRLVGTLGDLYGITISSSNVRGHRDQVSTTCPGDDLYARIVDIVAIGQRSRLGGDAPPPVVPDPPPTGPSVCRHSLGGVYAAGACSETYQCCDGAWHARSPGCGACTCTETNGAIGCTATSPTDPTPPPSDPAPSDPAPSDPAPTPAPSGPPAGASCAHSFGGSYANTACSASYQCCDGTWRARASGCGTCFCVEETGTSGCGLSSEPAPSPVPSGLPSAGLTLSGSEIPRAGLANATLRGALGLSTEPYGNVETFEGASFVRGRVSWFGGPRDTGVTTTETGAVSGERLRSLNSPLSPDAATLRSRPADYYYAAMRWSYSPNGTRWWRDARILVVNPATGAAVVVRPVDWGPNTSTRRVIDLSPQALSDLGLDTDGQALVSFAPAGTPLGRVR
ncbi:MAG: N-acetylmuramoyl-L-alanine amidase, partial [Sandaracinaceae bacterium]|nr:N-acetylmuramoyl-L-alanine amidase [Sandaracinaceae bacterium]